MIIVFNHKCAHLSFSFQYHLIHRRHPRLWHLVYRSDCSNKVFCCSREKGYQGIIDAPWVEGTTLGTVRVSDSFCIINTLNFHELSLRQDHWRLKLSRFHFAHLLLLSSSFRLWPACQAADSWHQRRFQSLVKLFGTDEPSIHIKEFEKHGKSKAKRNGDLTVLSALFLDPNGNLPNITSGETMKIYSFMAFHVHIWNIIEKKTKRFLLASQASHLSHHVISALERPTQLHPQISCDMQWQGMTSVTPGKLNKWWQIHPCFRSRGSTLNKPVASSVSLCFKLSGAKCCVIYARLTRIFQDVFCQAIAVHRCWGPSFSGRRAKSGQA